MKIVSFDANGKVIPDLSKITLSKDLSLNYFELLFKNRKEGYT